MNTGILGGSFDPVHNGHIRMAQSALKYANLDRVIFLPNGNPPHKDYCFAKGEDRYNMLCIALEKYSHFEVSDYEIKRTKPSYTVNSMRHFKKLYPSDNIMFIVGADSLNYLDKWKCADALRDENTFIAVNRNFSDNYSFENNIAQCRKNGYKIIKAVMEPCNISSTEIRRRIKCGESTEQFTDEKVMEYIKQNNIYR